MSREKNSEDDIPESNTVPTEMDPRQELIGDVDRRSKEKMKRPVFSPQRHQARSGGHYRRGR